MLPRATIMLPIIEKHKIHLICTKSLLMVNLSKIISQKNEDFTVEWHFAV